MKAIISQPMNRKSEKQIRDGRVQAIQQLEKLGYEVVDTIFPDEFDSGNIPSKYLAKSIEAIADVDFVYFMDGWEDASITLPL